ncbi:hypothetical protein ABH920_000681 [Catenulispora sp. EB89]
MHIAVPLPRPEEAAWLRVNTVTASAFLPGMLLEPRITNHIA